MFNNFNHDNDSDNDSESGETVHGFQFREDIIIKRIDGLESKMDTLIALFQNKVKETNNIFFYNPIYACTNDYIKVKNGKLLIRVTLIGVLKSIEDIKLYILNINDKYLTDKIKLLCYDNDNKLLMATFIKSVDEDNCYKIRNCQNYKSLKFPLLFIKE